MSNILHTILGSLSASVYSVSLEVGNLTVPAVVYDSLDEALLVAESLPAAASSLTQAAQVAFNQAFLTVIAAAAGMLFLSGLFISLAARRAKTS